MSIFSKLFSPSSNLYKNGFKKNNRKILSKLENIFQEDAELYTNSNIYNKNLQKQNCNLLIHPQFGVVIIDFFNYRAEELKGATATKAKYDDENVEIKSGSKKEYISLRFDEMFHSQIAPINSILICSDITEKEFDSLDKSFHKLLPKEHLIFSNSTQEEMEHVCFKNRQDDKFYNLQKIKQALFPELYLNQNRELASAQQQKFIYADLKTNLLLHGVPGSGMTSVLISKAVYEKVKNQKLKLLFVLKKECEINRFKSLLFAFVANAQWAIDVDTITVITIGSINNRSDKKSYDLVICDKVDEVDIPLVKECLKEDGKIIASSHFMFKGFIIYSLNQSYRISAELTLLTQGISDNIPSSNLQLQSGNAYMNTILIMADLLKEVEAKEISIVRQDKADLEKLQNDIRSYLTDKCYLFNDVDKKDGIVLYPFTHLQCVNNNYIIVIIDEQNDYDPIELISRANIKSFILSRSEDAYQILNKIKGRK